MNYVKLYVVRLEKDDTATNEFKQYTAFSSSNGHCFFAFSRIGNTWQWSVKHNTDGHGKAESQIRTKLHGGYVETWRGTVSVPEEWANDPKGYARLIQDFVEDARRGIESDPATVVSDAPDTPLGGLLVSARTVVSKMAVDPDSAVQDYSNLVGQVEAAQDDLDTVIGYMDTLRIMLAGQEARMG